MISLGRSIALFPFWRFDAKGGEVVLVGSPWDLHGFGHKHMRLSFLLRLCPSLSLCRTYLLFVSVELCGCYVYVLCERHMDF